MLAYDARIMRTLSGKRALVCGSSQGIGNACARELAKAGATITLVARDEGKLASAAKELSTDAGQSHDFIAADFTDPDALEAAVKAHIDAIGPYQILVNNTGGPPSGPILDAEPDAFITAIRNHVVNNQRLMRALLPGMKDSGYGRIINIISTSVIQPIQGLGVSNTTRGAVANWGRTVAGELAPFGITVNNVLPGYTDTQRLGSLFEKKAARTGSTPEAVKAATIEAIPMKRLADPCEIGAVVAFLASPAASYVTGVNLPVDGGRTAVQ